MARKQTNLNIVLGLINGEWIVAQYVFDHDGDFKGAVGSTFRVVTNAEYEDQMDPENLAERLEDLWQNEVKENLTELGLDAWVNQYVAACGDEAVYNLSYGEFHDEIMRLHDERLRSGAEDTEKAHLVECIGGGRCFNKDGYHVHKWQDFDWLNPDPKVQQAIKLIAEYEEQTVAQEKAHYAKKG